MRKQKIAVSIMCADMMRVGEEIRELERLGIDYIHCDVMDGHFVPNLMLPYQFINRMKECTRLPLDIHLMVERPEESIGLMDIGKGDYISVHWESSVHVERAVSLIHSKGAVPMLAVNPSTPVECTRDLLDELGGVLIMTVNPGFAGQSVVPGAFSKVKRMRRYLDDCGYKKLDIEVDGNCSFDNIRLFMGAGANIYVLGTSALYRKDLSRIECIERVREILGQGKLSTSNES